MLQWTVPPSILISRQSNAAFGFRELFGFVNRAIWREAKVSGPMRVAQQNDGRYAPPSRLGKTLATAKINVAYRRQPPMRQVYFAANRPAVIAAMHFNSAEIYCEQDRVSL
jgi:hypothetical protein